MTLIRVLSRIKEDLWPDIWMESLSTQPSLDHNTGRTCWEIRCDDDRQILILMIVLRHRSLLFTLQALLTFQLLLVKWFVIGKLKVDTDFLVWVIESWFLDCFIEYAYLWVAQMDNSRLQELFWDV